MKNNFIRLVDDKREIERFISSRSLLYDLEPIGIGTPYVESLSSYISRLAFVHNVSVTSLLKEVIAPVLKKEYIKKELNLGISKSTSQYINENSTLTLDYVIALEYLTGRRDLSYLTMLNWSGIFPKNIRSPYRKWCPICLDSMKLESKDIYEPLIWYLSDVKKCDKHQISLQDTCPVCKRNLSFFHSNLTVGYCQYCNSWLGTQKDCKKNFTKEDEFIILNYKQLIQKAPNSMYLPSRNFFSDFIIRIIGEIGFKSNARFSEFIEYDTITVWEWINNKYLPSHEALINVSQKLNLTIYEMVYIKDIKFNLDIEKYNYGKRKATPKKEIQSYLIKGINSPEPRSLTCIANEAGFSPDTAKRHFPLLCKKIQENYRSNRNKLKVQKQNDIERLLCECLSMEIPISLTQFLNKHGLTAKTARSFAPELCKRVSQRYKEYLAESKKKRIERILNDVQKAAIRLHNRGISPSKDKIQKELGNSVFLEDEIRERWNEIVFSLEYDND